MIKSDAKEGAKEEVHFEIGVTLNWPEAFAIVGVAFAIAAMVVSIVFVSRLL